MMDNFGRYSPSPSSPYMDKIFEQEFKRTMALVKEMSPSVFGLEHLDLVQSPVSSELQFFVSIKGFSSDNIFKELETCDFCFVSNKKEFTEDGHKAFSKLSIESVKAPKGYRLVACASKIQVPNSYKSPDPQIDYVGTDKVAEDAYLQYFWISEDWLYREETEVVTVSLKRVANHLGGISLMLTNGSLLYLVVQDRSRMRNTETKNIYYLGKSVEECLQEIKVMQETLVVKGFAFPEDEFQIQKEVGGVYLPTNLVREQLEPTMDLEPVMFEVSLAEEG